MPNLHVKKKSYVCKLYKYWYSNTMSTAHNLSLIYGMRMMMAPTSLCGCEMFAKIIIIPFLLLNMTD